jgi:hypothetical protein
VKARDNSQLKACVNNMRIIDSAKELATIESSLDVGATIPNSELSEFIKGGVPALVCPKGGQYALGLLGQEPECSVHGKMSEAKSGRRVPPQQTYTLPAEPYRNE